MNSHSATLQDVAAGIRSLPDASGSFAATQAAWRFFANDDTTLPVLMQPLLEAAEDGLRSACSRVALVVLDWSQLHYLKHASKADRAVLTNQHDLGYELRTALLLSDLDGSPIAPVHQGLRSAEGFHQADAAKPRPLGRGTKLDDLLPAFRFVAGLGWPVPPVFVIDREADSVDHYRRWVADGRLFVVRADDNRLAVHDGQQRLLPEVREALRAGGAFRESREVLYHGREAKQFVAETTVRLERPGKAEQGRVSKPGLVLELRLVVAEVRDEQGEVLAHWLLMTDVPGEFDAATVALWYYWRWRIESYFKLLKSAGLELEHWGQTTAAAVAKRLLVASMACVLAWKISRSAHPMASPLRKVLVRLSARQMKHGTDSTGPALLAGLWALLQGLALAEEFDLDELRQMLHDVLFDQVRPPGSPKRDV
ncbi:MAG: hypothetical protein K2W96_04370 [Gemmataceae bacterium]|nr:hypothetical protein [Gemmataceae bacterium]